jgi:hypothetical protein
MCAVRGQFWGVYVYIVMKSKTPFHLVNLIGPTLAKFALSLKGLLSWISTLMHGRAGYLVVYIQVNPGSRPDG